MFINNRVYNTWNFPQYIAHVPIPTTLLELLPFYEAEVNFF